MDVSPRPVSPAPQVPPPKNGCACCAMGCFSMFMVALAGLAVVLVGCWLIYAKVVNELTSSEPGTVQMEAPSEAQFAAASDKLQTLRTAARSNQSVTVEYTAADLNALIARHPDFTDLRGRFRVAIADSILTLDLSVPLRDIPLPKIRHRWLTGTARFGLAYDEGNFSFALRSLTANNHEVPLNALQSFSSTFDESFNEGFDKARREGGSHDFWENVKTLAVVDDKLVLTTKGAVLETTSP